MQHLYNKEQPETIRTLFNSIAPRYDLANSILSFHLHVLWNKKVAQGLLAQKPQKILDLCCGTGEIAFRSMKLALKQKSSLPDIYLVDFSEKMLEVAHQQALQFPAHAQAKMHFFEEDAMKLPFENTLFDAVSCAYGIRNVQNPQKCLQEIYRTLKPQGSCLILELTRPKQPLLNRMHKMYLSTLLPILGKWMTKDKEAYDYLQRSIHSFVCPDTLATSAKEIGFSHIEIKPLLGGIATLLTLRKI
ncbi:MAG: menG [Chlamydiia bacterium]|nr:menG [Chlamydiia bacterium]